MTVTTKLVLVLSLASLSSNAFAQAASSGLLFFPLPRQGEAAQVVEFRVRVDGNPILEELVKVDEAGVAAGLQGHSRPGTATPSKTLDGPESAAPALEMLSRDPDRLEGLYRLAKEGHQVEVEVVVDGQTARAFTFQEFLEFNLELKGQPGFQPLALPSRVQVRETVEPARAEGSPAMSTLCSQCEAIFPACAVTECPWWNPSMPPTHCFVCFERMRQCYATCQPDPCQPTVTVFTRTALFSRTPTGALVCRRGGFGNTLHSVIQNVFKEETVRRTVFCPADNRPPLEEIIATRFYSTFCELDIFAPCGARFPPFPTPCPL